MPLSDFDHAEKGDALYGKLLAMIYYDCLSKIWIVLFYLCFVDLIVAMELALSLEKLTNEKLLHVHAV